ncbi:HNH endonuclease signature motif containing protein [Halorussus marinus]|uniref:HNH endonuclease signature motif containing protein n=1 Tax=Halorussus marinus TaxID=2505976 RepID=UPI001092F49A|nr:HNH endonuclease signature motif containing protein [Halorussus marinus]
MVENYRQACLDAKGEKCIICGGGEDVLAHHIDGDRTNNMLENLVPVCPSCHGKIHAGAPGFEEWHQKLPKSAQIHSANNVKQRENWSPKQIHLPERLEDELEIVLDETNVQLRRDGADPLEKLMHWYPLVVQSGLEAVEEMDREEIQDLVEEFETDE